MTKTGIYVLTGEKQKCLKINGVGTSKDRIQEMSGIIFELENVI